MSAMSSSLELREQVVLVTGACKGLGLACAKAFRREGASVIMNYHSSSETIISELRSEESFRNGTLFYQADVTSESQVKEMFSAAESHFGQPLTTVVNNAMVGGFKFNGDARPKIHDLSWSHLDGQLQGFLRGALNTTQGALRGFEKAGFGRLINIGTNLLSNPVVPYHDYVAAKGSLLAFTRTSAAELGAKNITVNMVSGGLLRSTDASAATPEEVFKTIENMTPLRRVTTPEEVADVVVFFASPWSRGVTGQEINVDGGLVMR